MQEEQKSIVVAGHLCLDIIPSFPDLKDDANELFRPGGLSIVNALTLSTGGAVSNTGLSIAKLGLPVKLVAKVGNDPLGRLVLERVNSEGKNLARWIHSVKGEVTSYTIVINPPGTDRIFFHCPGSNDTFTSQDVPEQVFADAHIFHLGYPPIMRNLYANGGSELLTIFKRAKAKGVVTSLDMALPDPKGESGAVDWIGCLKSVFPYIDFFMPSIEEFLFMFDREEFDRLNECGGAGAIISEVSFEKVSWLSQRVLDYGCYGVLVKLGDRGVYLKTAKRTDTAQGLIDPEIWNDRELYSPVFVVEKMAGTTGAGDTTIAGFIASLYNNLPPETAVTMAVAVGGSSIEQPDAISGVGTWEKIRRRIESGWQKRDTVVEDSGWERINTIWKKS